MNDQEVQTKQIRHYYAEWKHPETCQWVRIQDPIPANSKEQLEEDLDENSGDFADFNSEFKRVKDAAKSWRAEYIGKYPIALRTVAVSDDGVADYEIELSDGTKWQWNDIDETVYFYLVEKLFNR